MARVKPASDSDGQMKLLFKGLVSENAYSASCKARYFHIAGKVLLYIPQASIPVTMAGIMDQVRALALPQVARLVLRVRLSHHFVEPEKMTSLLFADQGSR